jgi:zinc transporter, ZIP family
VPAASTALPFRAGGRIDDPRMLGREPVGGLIGVAAVTLIEPLLPLTLAFAAAAMLFVISSEIIPETHRVGFKIEGTFGLMIGFVMMMLDTTLG